jgi:L-amino acid N-acyltransferase YncA
MPQTIDTTGTMPTAPNTPKADDAVAGDARLAANAGSVAGLSPGVTIEAARSSDLPEIQAIYAHHVLHGTGTFEEVPPSIEDMQARHHAGLAAGYCWLVARDATGVLGFAYYGAFRARTAYRLIVEDSVYVREDVRGQGLGKSLVQALLAQAETAGFRQMLALIGDSANTGSIGMHVSLGFARTGVLRSVGLKFGRWLDVVIMQRTLGVGDAE